jgi:hypothetical protein
VENQIDSGGGAMRQEVYQVSWWYNNYYYAQDYPLILPYSGKLCKLAIFRTIIKFKICQCILMAGSPKFPAIQLYETFFIIKDDTFLLPFPTDLHFTEQQSPQLSSFPENPPTFSEEPPSQQQPMSLPQSTLYGSRGIPLHHPRELLSGPAIRIDLSQFQLGVGLTPCSLETLGIVPARSLIKGKFGSLSSLVIPRSYSRGTFKQHYPPSSSHSQPVIIRGIVPGSPVGVTRNLHEGMHTALRIVLKARLGGT